MTAASIAASVGKSPDWLTPWFTVASRAIEGDKGAMLGVAGGNLAERSAGPGDPRGRKQSRLWLARRAGVGGDANATTNCAPDVEGGAALLIAGKESEPEPDRSDNDRRHKGPAYPWPGIVSSEGALFARHYLISAPVAWRVTS